jgi:hypothetical protein
MPSKNERVELQMKIIRYRQVMGRTTYDKLLKQFAVQIAALQQKFREIDEQGRLSWKPFFITPD